jgi:hypothetical protein
VLANKEVIVKCKACNIETNNPKYCSRKCSTSTINKTKIKVKPQCLYCQLELPAITRKFCSNECQGKYKQLETINKWKAGKIFGLQVTGVVTVSIKEYLRQKYNNCCCICGWAEVNTFTGKIPLIADHIDGNWKNNTEENLRLICPNCDSLQSTYGGSNRGKGRTINGNLRKISKIR